MHGANQPCAGTFLPGGLVNPTCSAYINYLRHGRTRTNSPTEQLSMQSNYFQSWDVSAKVSYTAGDMNVNNWIESLTGREARTNLYNQTNSGPVFGRHVAATADFGATWRITNKLSLRGFIPLLELAQPSGAGQFELLVFSSRPRDGSKPVHSSRRATAVDSVRPACQRRRRDTGAQRLFRAGHFFCGFQSLSETG